MKTISLAAKRCLQAFRMLKKELFSSLLFVVETLRKLLSNAVKCAVKTSTLTASHCTVLNVADNIEVECF